MNQPKDTRSLLIVNVHTSVAALMSVLSVAGNSLICLAFYRNRRLRTITNFYVLSLAVTDIIGATFVYPFNAVASGLRKWPFGFRFCQFNGFLSYLWVVVSVGLLALTAVNRYFCIVKSQFYPTYFTRKKTVCSIIFVCLFDLVAGLISSLTPPVVFQWDPQYLMCRMTEMEDIAEKTLTVLFVSVFVGLPMGLILLCYGSVYRTIRRHNSAVIPSLQGTNSQGTVSAHEIQASRVLLVAVIAFCVCWIPTIVISTLLRVTRLVLPSLWEPSHILAASCSSWINPIIYGVMNRAMRKEFLKLLRCGKEN